jgi:hypothetical protein
MKSSSGGARQHIILLNCSAAGTAWAIADRIASNERSEREAALASRIFDLECPAEEGVEAGAELSAEQIDEVVNQLNGICRSSSLEFALRVGSVIIHHFYGGDTQAWRERGPKVHSFRRLAQHPELALSAGALYRCVALFEMCDRLRAPSRWRRLGASHLRAVIGIPAERQEYLLTKANEERWSVQALQAQAQTLRTARTRGGRRAQSVLGKHLSAVDRCLRNWRGALESVHSGEPEELERSFQLLVSMRSFVEELACAVETQRNRLAPDSGE